MASSVVFVPIPAHLYNEVVLRSRGRLDPATVLENQVETFLEQTEGDPDIWGEEHAEEYADRHPPDLIGSPTKGYHWRSLFLPNGTRLKMPYRGRDHLAEIRHQALVYEGQTLTPSQFASRVANGTARNAWRDIWVKRPNDKEWQLADRLRDDAERSLRG